MDPVFTIVDLVFHVLAAPETEAKATEILLEQLDHLRTNPPNASLSYQQTIEKLRDLWLENLGSNLERPICRILERSWDDVAMNTMLVNHMLSRPEHSWKVRDAILERMDALKNQPPPMDATYRAARRNLIEHLKKSFNTHAREPLYEVLEQHTTAKEMNHLLIDKLQARDSQLRALKLLETRANTLPADALGDALFRMNAVSGNIHPAFLPGLVQVAERYKQQYDKHFVDTVHGKLAASD